MSHPAWRILQVNSLLGGGGTDDQCVQLAAGLQRAGQRVWLAAPAGRPFETAVHAAGVPLLTVPALGVAKWRYIRALAHWIRREQIQIVHGHHGRDLWPTILAARLSGRRPRVVFTRHMANSPASWPSRHFLLGQCDALLAVSEFAAEVLTRGHRDPAAGSPERHWRQPIHGDHGKIRVVHGGIDTRRFRPQSAVAQRLAWGLQPGDFAFAVAGTYHRPRGKGQREFLAAAARIHEQVPHARFLIIGRGELAPELQADIQRLGLGGKAWLTPYCADMPAAMNAIDCLVHPALGTEAFGLVVCEAHACGKPVIASALDGIPEAFRAGACGELLPPEDVPALAAAMANWAQRPRLNETAQWQLHQRVDQVYSIAAATRRVSAVYAGLLSQQ
ncbi:MAG TPA: glycosyltransferase [Verrucomicrobiae bacterium]